MDKKRWAGVGVGVVALLASYVVGYQSGKRANPPKTVVVDHTEEVTRLKSQVAERERDIQLAQTQIQALKVELTIAKTKKVKKTSTTTHPDGTTTTTVTDTDETTNTTSNTASNTTTNTTIADKEKDKVKTDESEKVVEHTVTKTEFKLQAPTWLIGVDAGLNIPSLSAGANRGSILPGIPSWMDVGASIARRIAGVDLLGFKMDIYGAVRGSANGTLGLGLQVGF